MAHIFTDHLSGPGSAMSPLCVCVFVRQLSNGMTFDLDVRHGGSSWPNLDHLCRSKS